MISKPIEWILYTNLFVAIGATAATYSTDVLFNLGLHKSFYTFVFFATWSIYCFHWYLLQKEKNVHEREKWTQQHKYLLILIGSTCLMFSLYQISTLPYHYSKLIIPLIVAAFIYTAPKLAFRPFIYFRSYVQGKTIYLSLVWTYASCILPLMLASNTLSWQQVFFVAYRFLFIYVVCFLFDYKDAEDDKASGIKSFIHQINPKQGQKFVYVLLLIAGLFNVGLFRFISLDIWLIQFAVLIILWWRLNFLLQTKRDLVYYGFVDGLVFIVPIYIWLRNILP